MKPIMLILLLALWTPSPALADADNGQADLYQAENQARLAVLHAKVDQLAQIWSENLIVSTPRLGIVGDRARLIGAFEAGAVTYAQYDQDIEMIRIDGDTAVIMGTETAQSSPDSDPIQRRFTHVWIKREGQWKLLARHAHEVVE